MLYNTIMVRSLSCLFLFALLTSCLIQREEDQVEEILTYDQLENGNMPSILTHIDQKNCISYKLSLSHPDPYRDPEFSWRIYSADENALRKDVNYVQECSLHKLVIRIDHIKEDKRNIYKIDLPEEKRIQVTGLLRTIQFNTNTDIKEVHAQKYGSIYFEMLDSQKRLLVIPLNAIAGQEELPTEKKPFYSPYAKKLRNIVNNLD